MTEWEPIDTAPKDNQLVLLYEEGRIYTGRRRVPHDYWDWNGEEDGGFGKPTHWMPLPSPPTQEPS